MLKKGDEVMFDDCLCKKGAIDNKHVGAELPHVVFIHV